jgi:hypothetical protein
MEDISMRTISTLKLGITIALSALISFSLGGCKTWATSGEHAIAIEAPPKVNRGEKFTFTVYTKDTAGTPVSGIEYLWSIDWVDLPGISHKGKSGAQEKINVKGAPGTATLHIKGYNAAGDLVELSKHDFTVE